DPSKTYVAYFFTDDKRRTLMHQVSTLGERVSELENKNAQLLDEKGKVEKQLEETKQEAQVISRQKEEVESSLKGQNEMLGLKVLNVEEKYNHMVEKLQMELCALVKEKEKMMMESEDLKRRLEEIQAKKDLMESEKDMLRSEAMITKQKQIMFEAEIERLNMELVVLTEAKKAAAKACEAQNDEIMKELEDLKRKFEELQTNKDLVQAKNDELLSNVLAIKEKYGQSEAEVKKLQMELSALVMEKEVAVKTFDDEKDKMMMESADLKRRLEEIQANKDLVESENDRLRSEALITKQKQIMFEAKIETLNMELVALTEAKEAAAKACEAQNDEITKELEDLKRKFEELQTNKDLVEGENDKLQSEVLAIEEKYGQSEAKVKWLNQILRVVVEAKDAAAKACEAEKVEILKESGNLKRRVEEILVNKDLVESENDVLRSDILTLKQKYNQFEVEVKSLKNELEAFEEEKEVTAKAFNVEKTEILKELEDLKMKVLEIQAKKDLVESENNVLQLDIVTTKQKYNQFEVEIKSLKNELKALEEEKEVTAKAFNVEKAEILKELEDLKRKVQEIQANKYLVEGENDKLRLDVSTAEQKESISEAEVKRLWKILDALMEAKEVTTKAFDAEKEKIMKELEDLKRKVEEIQASKDLAESEKDKLRMVEEIQVGKKAAEKAVHDKDAEAHRLRDELVKIRVSLSELQASYNELDAKYPCLNDEKNSV
ncbi:Os04g0158400, partial [Oryza sativa Japonica Group]